MNLTPAQLADLRGIVAERIGAPEITEDRMICPACGGYDYGPNVQPSELTYYVHDNLLPSYLRGVCLSDECGHVQEPTGLYVVEATADHVRDLYDSPADSVVWLNYPQPDDGLPFLEIVPRRQAISMAIIGYRSTIRTAISAADGPRSTHEYHAQLWQSSIGGLFPPF